MDRAVEDARAEGNGAGREGSGQDSEHGAHAGNDAATHEAARPLIRADDLRTYAEAGMQLIPLHRWNAKDQLGRSRGKTPRDGKWQARDYNSHRVIEDARRNGTNVGVRLPADVMVLDVDPRNFEDGKDPLADLVRHCGIDLTLCPHTLTGSGGHHYWFKKPADVTLLDSLKDYQGVEFKSFGRQVVAAGSVHPCGQHYEWDDLAPPLGTTPPMPETLLRLARRPDRAHGDASAFGELTPEMLAETLYNLDPSDHSSHDDWLTLMMACHHATAGEGRQEFIDWSTRDPEYADHGWIIGRRWDSLHFEPSNGRRAVTVKYLHKVVQEAGFEVARREPEDDFDIYDAPPEERKLPRWRFISLEELESLPPPTWLVRGLLTESSLGAIYGPPESFKSFLALDLSLSVAAGISWSDHPVSAGAVLYIAGEGAAGLSKRVRAWKRGRGVVDVLPFKLMRDEVNFASENVQEVRDFVDAVVQQVGPLKLVVIDTLNQTASGADENAAKDMSRYIASMKRIRDATGAAVVVVHHSGKDPLKGMRGSNALLGALDTAVEVERKPPDGSSITVKVKKQKDSEHGSPMRLNLEKMDDSLVLRATVMDDPAADFGGPDNPLLDLACDMALKAGGRFPMKQLVDAVIEQDGISPRQARRNIDGAIRIGREAAVRAADGARVWREQPGANPNGPYFVHAELEER